MSYHIGSFNIRDFNYSNKSKDGEEINRNFNKIADIIISESYDALAIQEVNSESALSHLVSVLNRRRNIFREYAYSFGGNMPTHSKDPERYGFIWNKKRLKLLDILKKKNPTYYTNANGNDLQRPPYYARFTGRGLRGGSNFELRLINIHILWGKNETDRIREFNILVKQVLPRICDHRELPSHGEMMPAYTLLLGDYNLCLNNDFNSEWGIKSIAKTDYTGKERIFKTVQEEKTSLNKVNEQQSIDECYANNYDHFTYEAELAQKLNISEVGRVNALEKYYKTQPTPVEKLRNYREQISDHVPIYMNLDVKKHFYNNIYINETGEKNYEQK